MFSFNGLFFYKVKWWLYLWKFQIDIMSTRKKSSSQILFIKDDENDFSDLNKIVVHYFVKLLFICALF